MPLRKLSRISALPILLAAGTLHCRATPITPSNLGTTDPAAQPLFATSATQPSAIDFAEPAGQDHLDQLVAEDVANPAGQRVHGRGFCMWFYALGSCAAVALAAWFNN